MCLFPPRFYKKRIRGRERHGTLLKMAQVTACKEKLNKCKENTGGSCIWPHESGIRPFRVIRAYSPQESIRNG